MIAVLALGVLAGFALNRWSEQQDSETPATVAPPSSAPATVAAEPTIPPEQLVEVDQVWLIDRSDGVFDWGVSVRTPQGAPTRSGVVIDVRLIGEDDRVVHVASGEVNGIGPESIGAVAGRLTDDDGVPARIEFDVAVGVETNDRSLGDVLDIRGLERTTDSVRGRIRVEASTPIGDVTMVLLWFDEAGDVVAAVPKPVDQVRPDVDARFEIDLDGEVVPDGRPDAVVWTT